MESVFTRSSKAIESTKMNSRDTTPFDSSFYCKKISPSLNQQDTLTLDLWNLQPNYGRTLK
jgi:hypothetical protein